MRMGLLCFNDLAICQTGRRRLRVWLGVFSVAGMTVEARAGSHIFHVNDTLRIMAQGMPLTRT
ncbi:hypothetical protein N7497_012178 [Penicillium chrysogenum]|nr:hypothetical protein N7497_012178 [Penicillium chrysogenum]